MSEITGKSTLKTRSLRDRLTVMQDVGPLGYLASIVMVAAATLVCNQARPYLSPVNMVMAYLLVVVLAALFLGRRPAMLSAFLGVLAFDFFFVPPRFSFSVAEKEYLMTFFALFTVGLVISSLVAKAHWGRYHQNLISQMFDRVAGADVFTNEEYWYYTAGDLADPRKTFTVEERDALAAAAVGRRS